MRTDNGFSPLQQSLQQPLQQEVDPAASSTLAQPPVFARDPGDAGAGDQEVVGLKTVHAFLQALREQGVEYCHWKSNVRLAEALRGETDLDLLVNRQQSQRFRQILYQYAIKPVLAAPGKRYPAVEDYLGFDAESGRSFHLHVHYQLVLGEQFVKNYRLPLETHFLASVRWLHGVAIPSPELEIIVLSMRALLKYRDRDVIKDIFKIRYPGIPDHILQEIHYLLGQTSLSRIEQTLGEIAHLVPAEVVLAFLTTVTAQPRAGYRFYRLRQAVRQSLNRYQRRNRVQAITTYFHELWSRRNTFLRFSPTRQMTPVNGGLTLALVGADGAGKSTMSALLRKWLGWKLDVRTYYLGSKQPSRRSRALYMLFRMLRRSHSELTRRLDAEHWAARWLARTRDTARYLHHLSIGHDRFGRYQEGMKQAMAGSIVIFDRFPLESIGSGAGFRLLDGPQIALAAGESNAVARRLAQAEERLYLAMRPPDLLLVLDVSPDVSLLRKPDHQLAAVEAKAQAIGELLGMGHLQGQGIHVIHLNADLPLETVLAQIQSRVWALI